MKRRILPAAVCVLLLLAACAARPQTYSEAMEEYYQECRQALGRGRNGYVWASVGIDWKIVDQNGPVGEDIGVTLYINGEKLDASTMETELQLYACSRCADRYPRNIPDWYIRYTELRGELKRYGLDGELNGEEKED